LEALESERRERKVEKNDEDDFDEEFDEDSHAGGINSAHDLPNVGFISQLLYLLIHYVVSSF